jgi:hypothetical protein
MNIPPTAVPLHARSLAPLVRTRGLRDDALVMKTTKEVEQPSDIMVQKTGLNGRMSKTIKYTWIVLRALITLAVALECFLIADNKVYTVLVSLLILIYLQNAGAASIFGRVMYSDLAIVSKHLRQIRKKLDIRDWEPNGEEDEPEEELSTSEQIMLKLKEQAVQEFVFLVQTAIMHIMVLFFLIKTVFF